MKGIHHSVTAAAVVFAGVLAASAGQSTLPQEPPAPAPQAQAQAPAAQAPAPTLTPEDEKNAAIYTRTCSLCHDAQRILTNRRTRDQWGEVIDKMIERGAQGSEEDFTAVLEYLVSQYGRINVNRGSAADLATVLKLSDAEAQAIVAFRKDTPIADFETLSRVPGIDAAKLSQNRDAISY